MFTLIIMGGWFLLESLLSQWFPRILLGKKLEREFVDRPKERKRYLLHQRVNIAFCGSVMVGLAFAPERFLYPIGVPLLILGFVSILWCNKRNLGRFTPFHVFTE